eukprot:gene9632-7546_t
MRGSAAWKIKNITSLLLVTLLLLAPRGQCQLADQQQQQQHWTTLEGVLLITVKEFAGQDVSAVHDASDYVLRTPSGAMHRLVFQERGQPPASWSSGTALQVHGVQPVTSTTTMATNMANESKARRKLMQTDLSRPDTLMGRRHLRSKSAPSRSFCSVAVKSYHRVWTQPARHTREEESLSDIQDPASASMAATADTSDSGNSVSPLDIQDPASANMAATADTSDSGKSVSPLDTQDTASASMAATANTSDSVNSVSPLGTQDTASANMAATADTSDSGNSVSPLDIQDPASASMVTTADTSDSGNSVSHLDIQDPASANMVATADTSDSGNSVSPLDTQDTASASMAATADTSDSGNSVSLLDIQDPASASMATTADTSDSGNSVSPLDIQDPASASMATTADTSDSGNSVSHLDAQDVARSMAATADTSDSGNSLRPSGEVITQSTVNSIPEDFHLVTSVGVASTQPFVGPRPIVDLISTVVFIVDMCGQGGGPAASQQEVRDLLFDAPDLNLGDYFRTCSRGIAKLGPDSTLVLGPIRMPCSGTSQGYFWSTNSCETDDYYGWQFWLEDWAARQISKCTFTQPKTVFLGFQVSSDGLSVDPKKIAAVADWSLPHDSQSTRSFLGFTGFSRRFIKDYAKIAAPLTELTKTSKPFPHPLPQPAVDAFHILKAALIQAPLLVIPFTGTTATFELYMDASGLGVGAVLLQDQGKGPQPPNMTIVYKPGPENQADALSRLFLAAIVDLLPHQPENPKRPSFLEKRNDLWYFKGRLCVPNIPELRLRILHEYHDVPSAGHPGFHKTLNAVADKFWWPRMTRTVRSYVASCPTCQRTKPSSMCSPGQLRPHDVPSRPWSHVSVDLITDLPRSVCYDGVTYDAIATFVCMLTKQAIFVRINKTITAPQLANVYLDGTTPFYANYGFHPASPAALIVTSDVSSEATDYMSHLKDVQASVNRELEFSKAQQAEYANRHRRPLQFSVGDQVRLSSDFISLYDQPSAKLRHRFLGPFTVLECIPTTDPTAYKLDLPSSMSRVHPVFHVSRLLPWTPNNEDEFPGRHIPNQPIPAAKDYVYGDAYEVDRILDVKIAQDPTSRARPKADNIFFLVTAHRLSPYKHRIIHHAQGAGVTSLSCWDPAVRMDWHGIVGPVNGRAPNPHVYLPGVFSYAWVSGDQWDALQGWFHEIGHNYNLGHADTKLFRSSDFSSAMGWCCTLRCMNPAQNWQLGWSDAVAAVDSSQLKVGTTMAFSIPPQHTSTKNFIRITADWVSPPSGTTPSNWTPPSFWLGYRSDSEPYDTPSLGKPGVFSNGTNIYHYGGSSYVDASDTRRSAFLSTSMSSRVWRDDEYGTNLVFRLILMDVNMVILTVCRIQEEVETAPSLHHLILYPPPPMSLDPPSITLDPPSSVMEPPPVVINPPPVPLDPPPMTPLDPPAATSDSLPGVMEPPPVTIASPPLIMDPPPANVDLPPPIPMQPPPNSFPPTNEYIPPSYP